MFLCSIRDEDDGKLFKVREREMWMFGSQRDNKWFVWFSFTSFHSFILFYFFCFLIGLVVDWIFSLSFFKKILERWKLSFITLIIVAFKICSRSLSLSQSYPLWLHVELILPYPILSSPIFFFFYRTTIFCCLSTHWIVIVANKA